MKSTPFVYLFTLLLFTVFACKEKPAKNIISPEDLNSDGLSGAGLAMDHWTAMRAYPNGELDIKAYTKAFQQKRVKELTRTTPPFTNWEAIGPKNIGGRTLCLAFHPDDPEVIFAGSAGGGLWKTTTAGLGYVGWTEVETGYPVIGVPAIAIDPSNADVMYIGTGEVYNYEAAAPGNVNRITRGSYGIGILKTTNGGDSWSPSLDWSLGEMKGVQKIVINPLNSNTIFAATTDGLLRSYDSGASWGMLNDKTMAVDIEISPADTSLILVSYGNMNSPDKGVFRSTDAGNNFSLSALTNNYTGKTMLAFSPSDPNIVYASVADEFEGVGLYRSTNAGISWSLMNTEDVPKYQGWYAHDLVVKPNDPDYLVYVGVDSWRSFDGGQTLTQKSFWDAWTFGQVPVGGPEGPEEYVHADIHAAYYHPNDPSNVYLATDGGIFVSFDDGNTFEGRNGSYQTQQFYANFSNSATDSLFAIGGMQDNSTAFYTGDDAWTRVIGGDGMSTAINAENDNIVYGTYQNLNIRRSDNRGESFWNNVTPPGSGGEYRAFNGAYELAPSDQSILYAGTTRLYRSNDDGDNWFNPSPANIDGDNIIFKIGISPTDPDLIYVSTAPNTFISNSPPPGHVYKSTNGGINWTLMTGLPQHTVSDIAFHLSDENQVYLTYSGFGVNHVWQTTDGGATWETIGEDLPDVPTNTIAIDTTFGTQIYVGNDLGVYWSPDDGQSWDVLSNGLSSATMVMDVTISTPANKLRIATHGNGIWQADLAFPVATDDPKEVAIGNLKVYPNPVRDRATIEFYLKETASQLVLSVYDNTGKLVEQQSKEDLMKGKQGWGIVVGAYVSGLYYVVLEGEGENRKGWREATNMVVE